MGSDPTLLDRWQTSSAQVGSHHSLPPVSAGQGRSQLKSSGLRGSLRSSGSAISRRSGRAESIGTSASGLSRVSSTVWKEVDQAVQDEVLKIIKPLQEQIQSEAEARQRAEAALARAGIQPPVPELPADTSRK